MSDPSQTDAPDRSLYQSDFSPAEFARRRGKIFDAIGADGFALLQGAAPVRGFDVFRQSNEFYYCGGVEVAQACLLLAGPGRKTTLYLPHRPRGRSAEGAEFAAEDADLLIELTGVDRVAALEQLGEDLEKATIVYTPHSPAEGRNGSRDELLRANRLVADDPWDGRATREQHLIGLLAARLAHAQVRDLSPILDALRAIKSEAELSLLREAGRLAALACVEAMRATRPGLIEGQLGAIATYVYLYHGARGEGYRHIIASGENTWNGHYFRNNCAMQNGDLVLMDTAPDCGNYTSDIGRMWPVNGTYAPWQRELYGFMVKYHKTLLSLIRPGATADRIHADAAERMAEVAERTAWSKPVYAAAAGRTLEFKGHLSHPVGMAVHDVGGYRDQPLRPGVVFTVDPQMWVPEERKYIRVEDTVAVTEGGAEVLTAAAPLDLDTVEATMREPCRFPLTF